MTHRRVGFFKMSGNFYRRMLDDGEGAAVFAGFVPLQIEENFRTDELKYYGMHEQFRPVPLGEITPEYVVSLRAGDPFPTWTEVKP